MLLLANREDNLVDFTDDLHLHRKAGAGIYLAEPAHYMVRRHGEVDGMVNAGRADAAILRTGTHNY